MRALEIPRTFADLCAPTATQEELHRLTDAKVVFADYRRIAADFSQESGGDFELTNSIQRRLDAWLLDHAAIVSASQIAPNDVNTPIATSGPRVKAVRPPRYGRAVVVAARDPFATQAEGDVLGLLDVKGVGVSEARVPERSMHGTGLLPLEQALNDVLFQTLIERIFEHSGSVHHCLPVYAVIDTGFDVRDLWAPGHPARPAGIMVRRAHRRMVGNCDLPAFGSEAQRIVAEIEMLLRQYGVATSTADGTLQLTRTESGLKLFSEGEEADGYSETDLQALHRFLGSPDDIRIEGINIQTTRDIDWPREAAQLVDFGQYEVRGRFNNPVLSQVMDRPLRWGGLLFPDAPGFVQPNAALAIDATFWAHQKASPGFNARFGLSPGTRLSGPMERSMLLAESWRSGEMSGAEVHAELMSLVENSTAHWSRSS